MNKKFAMLKSMVIAAGLVTSVSAMAGGGDSSMDPVTGDSYAYFNGGHNQPQGGNPVIDKAPSSFRQEDPHGLPLSTYEAMSSEAPEYQPAPVIDKEASSFYRDNPHGLPFSYYEGEL